MELVSKHFHDLSPEELYEILKLRVDVFVVEQNCPYPELDNKDQDAIHLCLREDGVIKACLRVLAPGVSFEDPAIGRVVAAQRRKGYASRLLAEGIRCARELYGNRPITIEAQCYAREFYEKAGFRQTSEEFLEDGIPHIRMTLPAEGEED